MRFATYLKNFHSNFHHVISGEYKGQKMTQPAIATSSLALNDSWITIGIHSTEAPDSAVRFSDLTPTQETVESSGHTVRKMIYSSGVEGVQTVYFKECDPTYPPILAQMESAASSSYRIVRKKCAALVRPVVDEKDYVIGSISFEIPGFESMVSKKLTAAQLVEANAAEALFARYVREEDDSTPSNIGYSEGLGLVDIDYDMSFYPISSQLKGPRLINNGFTAPHPSQAFPITKRDLANFPDIVDAQPCYWPTKIPNNWNIRKNFPSQYEFRKLNEIPEYLHRLCRAKLLELLIDHPTHCRVMATNYENRLDAKRWQALLEGHILKRYQNLRTAVVDNSTFRKFIVHHRKALQECKQHFVDYNHEIAPKGVSFDIEQIDERYHEIVKECLVKELLYALYDIAGRKVYLTEFVDNITDKYQSLLQKVIIFRDSPVQVRESFALLDEQIKNVSLDKIHAVQIKWMELCDHVYKIVENYRGVIDPNSQSVATVLHVPHPVDNPLSYLKRVRGVEVIATQLQKWVNQRQNSEQIVDVVRQCMEEYRPVGVGTWFAKFNPGNYTRTRTEDMERLICDLSKMQLKKELKENAVSERLSEFLSNGSWNESGVCRSASANVLIIAKLCKATLESFANELSLEHLKDHRLVEISFSIKQGNLDLEQMAFDIFKHLQQQEKDHE